MARTTPSGRGGRGPRRPTSRARSAWSSRKRWTGRMPAARGPSTSGPHVSPTNSVSDGGQAAPVEGVVEDPGVGLAGPGLGRGDDGVDQGVEADVGHRRLRSQSQLEHTASTSPRRRSSASTLGHLVVGGQGVGLGRPVEVGHQRLELVVAHAAGPGPGAQPVELPGHVGVPVGGVLDVLLAVDRTPHPLAAPRAPRARPVPGGRRSPRGSRPTPPPGPGCRRSRRARPGSSAMAPMVARLRPAEPVTVQPWRAAGVTVGDGERCGRWARSPVGPRAGTGDPAVTWPS